jgi:hypothetical protein
MHAENRSDNYTRGRGRGGEN